MKGELRLFFTALMFLTRLPVPRFTDHAPEYLERCSKYFPLIGYLVGGISAGVFALAVQVFSAETALLFSIAAGILTTGAFHEDGFADVCDAFGGGWTKEKILDIMKDSRLGTYGVAGLVLMLGGKFLLLRELTAFFDLHRWSGLLPFGICILLAHALSRFMAVLMIQISTYAYESDASKSKPLASRRLGGGALLLAGVFPAILFFFLPPASLLAIPATLVVPFWCKRYFEKWIGGYTGDCLGSVQQLAEVVCYLTLILVWKFT